MSQKVMHYHLIATAGSAALHGINLLVFVTWLDFGFTGICICSGVQFYARFQFLYWLIAYGGKFD